MWRIFLLDIVFSSLHWKKLSFSSNPLFCISSPRIPKMKPFNYIFLIRVFFCRTERLSVRVLLLQWNCQIKCEERILFRPCLNQHCNKTIKKARRRHLIQKRPRIMGRPKRVFLSSSKQLLQQHFIILLCYAFLLLQKGIPLVIKI